jgi:cyclopropane-fatty-acyl-phospholipid synthase
MRRDPAQPLRIPGTAGARTDAALTVAAGKSLGFEKWLLRTLLHSAGNPPLAVALWDGQEVNTSGAAPKARMMIADRAALFKLCLNPDLQFGELYTEGRLHIEGDLETFALTLNGSVPDLHQRSLWTRILAKLYLIKRNTLTRAKDNIHHHYDLGNEFYQLWLDDQMVYTCAYFPSADTTLEAAQVAKMDHVARKLRLKPGEEVVEAGCGWGALALHLAKHYGVKVKAYNISKEQLAYARSRAQTEGLNEQVTYIEGDYREIQGDYDAFVSVGMLEHVGLRHYGELGAVIDRCLRPHGRGLIHTIGRNRPAPMNAWIERRIFPGAYPPSLGQMAAIFEPYRFSILDMENIRLHYATTLHHWLERFEANVERVRKMFDEPFIRAWRLYLTGSSAAFLAGELQLFQVVFNRYHNNDLPPTRAFLYGST